MAELPEWRYDEFRQVGVDFGDPARVAAHDRGRDAKATAARELLARLGFESGQTLIDFGTGTGVLASEAAKLGLVVHAVDVSRAMLQYAERMAAAEGVGALSFHHAGFLTYRHDGAPADLVVTRAAFHHLPDLWKQVALSRIARMLRPGGCLYLADVAFSFDPGDCRRHLEAWVGSAAPGGACTAEDLAALPREEFGTFTWILEGMFERAGFEIRSKEYPSSMSAEYVCVKCG